MDKVYQLLTEIKKLPEIYLGKLSFERFHSFVDGFCSNETNDAEGCCLDGFTEFVAKHYKMGTDHGWYELIQFFNFDEKSAFETFYELLDQHIKRKNVRKRRAARQIECVTFDDCMRVWKRREEEYYSDKWAFVSLIVERINKLKPDKVLELYPSDFTFVRDSDILCNDIGGALRVQSGISTKVITHNPAVIPWPIADKSYDLFLSLHAFERLGGKMAEIFQEIKRVARYAILSFPSEKICPLDDEVCSEQFAFDDDMMDEWTKHEPWVEGFSIPGSGDRAQGGERTVYLWKF
jgi:hypothetical protein